MRCPDKVGVQTPYFTPLDTPLLDVKFRILLTKAPHHSFKELPEIPKHFSIFVEMKYVLLR